MPIRGNPFYTNDGFRIAARAARYSSSVISVASFCRGGWAGGGLARLDDDVPTKQPGLRSPQLRHRVSAAFANSPSEVSSRLEDQQLQPVEIDNSRAHGLDL